MPAFIHSFSTINLWCVITLKCFIAFISVFIFFSFLCFVGAGPVSALLPSFYYFFYSIFLEDEGRHRACPYIYFLDMSSMSLGCMAFWLLHCMRYVFLCFWRTQGPPIHFFFKWFVLFLLLILSLARILFFCFRLLIVLRGATLAYIVFLFVLPIFHMML